MDWMHKNFEKIKIRLKVLLIMLRRIINRGLIVPQAAMRHA
jgi:hypothetical protein